MSKLIKTGNLRARAIRLMWYWQAVQGLLLIALFFKNYEFHWLYLLAIPIGLFGVYKLSMYDSNVTMKEEFEFLYRRQPVRNDIEKLTKMVGRLESKVDAINRINNIQKKEIEP